MWDATTKLSFQPECLQTLPVNRVRENHARLVTFRLREGLLGGISLLARPPQGQEGGLSLTA